MKLTRKERESVKERIPLPLYSVFGLLFFIGALSLAVWGLERDPPYDVFRGYTHTFDTDDIGGGEGGEHERLTRKQ